MLQYLAVCADAPAATAACARPGRDVAENCTFCEKLHYFSQPSTSNSALNRRQSHSQRDGSSPIPAPPHATKSKMSV